MRAWSLNNTIRTPLLLVGLTETIVLASAVYVGALLGCGSLDTCQDTLGSLAPRAAVVAGFSLTSLIAMGLYHFHQRLYFWETLARIVVGLGFAGLILALVFALFPQLKMPWDVSAFGFAYAMALIISLRYIFVATVDKNIFRRRTLIYGAGHRAESICEIRRRADRRGFVVVGQIPADGESGNTRYKIEDAKNRSICDIAEETGADEIVVAVDDRRGKLPVRELLDAKLKGIAVIDLLEFLERETGKIRVDLVSPGWLIFSRGFRRSRTKRLSKRAVDLFVSSAILLLFWPVMLLVVLAIKAEDGLRAPVLYRQVRVGEYGKHFPVLKFRSMRINAEADGKAVWAEKNDPRITRVGSFLRKTRLDELPQLLNVFRGEMSLVGPRPERPEFVEELKEQIPHYAERHAVKPGLTGWAQLRYAYGATHEDAVEKLQYDLYYVKNQSAILDIMILLQTVEVVLWGKGAR